jgi:hypothetical protein
MLILLLGDATMWHHYQLTLALMMEAPWVAYKMGGRTRRPLHRDLLWYIVRPPSTLFCQSSRTSD